MYRTTEPSLFLRCVVRKYMPTSRAGTTTVIKRDRQVVCPRKSVFPDHPQRAYQRKRRSEGPRMPTNCGSRGVDPTCKHETGVGTSKPQRPNDCECWRGVLTVWKWRAISAAAR